MAVFSARASGWKIMSKLSPQLRDTIVCLLLSNIKMAHLLIWSSMRSSILWTPQHLPTYTFTHFQSLSLSLLVKPFTSSLSRTSARSPCATTRSKWRIKRSAVFTTHSSPYASARPMLFQPGMKKPAIRSSNSSHNISSQVVSKRWLLSSKLICIKQPSLLTSKASTLRHIAQHTCNPRRRTLAGR